MPTAVKPLRVSIAAIIIALCLLGIGLWTARAQAQTDPQVEQGALGRKAGRGFTLPPTDTPAPLDAAEISLRIEATLANEGAWLLSEGGTTADGIDAALRLGLNFPRGPFEIIARHGRERVLATLAALEAKAPAQLKTRYLPAPGLMP